MRLHRPPMAAARGVRQTVVGVCAALLAGCSPLAGIDALMPYDDGAAKVAGDLAYGPQGRQTLDVYRPADRAHAPDGPPYPVVVFVYGGSWASGSKADYGFVGHALAARGFLAVVPDYRLVPAVRYPAFVRDAAAAVRWARDHAAAYGGDPARIAVAGHSAGAYNAIMLASDPRYTDPASPDHLPLRAAAGLAGPYDFLPIEGRVLERAFAGVDDPAATQPVKLVTADGPPLFLAHGTADRTVRPANSRALAKAARARGRAVTLELYRDLNHAETLLALGRWWRREAPVLDDLTAFLRDALDVAEPAAFAR